MKDTITNCMTKYAQDVPEARFIGYNTSFGSKMYGTLAQVAKDQCIEAPVAENLMVGLALGMSLEGFRPVVCFERHDFLLLALDAILNHLDKIPAMSGGKIQLPVIVRAITARDINNQAKLKAGPQHTQDYTHELRSMVKNIKVHAPTSGWQYEEVWEHCTKTSEPSIIVEYREMYEWED